MSSPCCQAITKSKVPCTRQPVSGTKFCWQHKKFVIQETNISTSVSIIDSDTELMIFSYLPIQESMNLFSADKKTQQKLIKLYAANYSDAQNIDESPLTWAISQRRVDLIAVLLDKNVGHVWISDKYEAAAFIEALPLCKSLQDLKYNLTHRNFNFGLIETLANITSLRSIDFAYQHFDATDFTALTYVLKANPNIQKLNFYLATFCQCGALNLFLESLVTNTSITTISFDRVFEKHRHTDETIQLLAKIIAENKTITSLNLSCAIRVGSIMNTIDPCIIKACISNTSLTDLELEKNELKRNNYTILAQISSRLTRLNIGGNTTDGIEILFTALETNSSLLSLDLANIKLDESGLPDFSTLIRLIKVNRSITDLNLTGTLNTPSLENDIDINELILAINQNPRITKLNLSSNWKANNYHNLIYNRHITSLNLHNSDILNREPEFLSDLLNENKTILDLNFGHNLIHNRLTNKNKFQNDLSKALSRNCSLTKLDLSDNRFEKKTIQQIFQGLQTNTTLTQLNFRQITTKYPNSFIADLFNVNNTLKRLKLGSYTVESGTIVRE